MKKIVAFLFTFILMKQIVAFLFAFILILNVSGHATEVVPVNLGLYENSSAVGEIYSVGSETFSEPRLEKHLRAMPESISLLFLGLGLVSFGVFARKKRSRG